MTFPTIHLNGSHPGTLIDNILTVTDLLAQALQGLQIVQPHGRDYYVQGDTALSAALGEHSARVKAIQDVRAQLIKIADHIQDTRGNR